MPRKNSAALGSPRGRTGSGRARRYRSWWEKTYEVEDVEATNPRLVWRFESADDKPRRRSLLVRETGELLDDVELVDGVVRSWSKPVGPRRDNGSV